VHWLEYEERKTMDKIPFSVYDFFAYLSSGSVLVLTADYIWGLGLLTRPQITILLGITLIVLTYVVGQIVAHFSAFLFEQLVVTRLFKRPSVLLVRGKPQLNLFALLFPNYFRPLPEETQYKILQKARSHGCVETGEVLFLHAYPLVTANERMQMRLDDFRNQYGFARNMAFAFFVSSIAISIAHQCGQHPVRWRWVILAAFGGLTMFYRYLKFFRQYSVELLVRFSALV
jgi:hypothetical protein